ncbi:hypothetical protein BZK28_07715 [Helicobacter pylori]|nr:hypothetical protein BZK28_07715 [Helicobacter pylori]
MPRNVVRKFYSLKSCRLQLGSRFRFLFFILYSVSVAFLFLLFLTFLVWGVVGFAFRFLESI